MRFSQAAAFVFSAVLVPQAMGALVMTEPVASTTCSGGSACSIVFKDDGTAPTLAQIGLCQVGLFAGSTTQQTLLQQINPSFDVSTATTLSFNVDATVGPDATGVYFIRFTSATAKEPGSPLLPYQSFSAKFSLTGMTGTFNATVSAEVAGASVAGSAAATTTGSGSGLTVTTAHSSTTTSHSSSTTSSTHSNGAPRSLSAVGVAGFGALMSLILGLAL